MTEPLLARLRDRGLLDEEAVEAVRVGRDHGQTLDDALIRAFRQTGGDEAALLRALAEEFDLPFVDLDAHRPDAKLLGRFPARVLLDRSLLPLEQHNGSVLVATARPFDTTGLDELRLASGLEINLALAAPTELARQLTQHLGVGADTVQVLDDDENDLDLAAAEDASIVKFVNQVLTEAIEKRATDVHFEPFEASLRVRYRIDGVLQQAECPATETAEIAVQASLTGHLVFSTLHTNNAPGAVTRLIDMGVEPYLVASSLELVMAQRLVRLICEQCKTNMASEAAARLREQFGDALPEQLFIGRGCRACQNTGYRGRRGIFELMPISEPIRRLILDRRSAGDIRQLAIREGMASLREDGWRLIGEGLTTVEEVLRVTKDERIELDTPEATADMTMNTGGLA